MQKQINKDIVKPNKMDHLVKVNKCDAKSDVLSTVFLIGVDGFRKSCRQLIFWLCRLWVDTVSDTSNLTRTFSLAKTCLHCCRSRCLGSFCSPAKVSFSRI